MAFPVLGDPLQVWIDAVGARLRADATLAALVTTITAAPTGRARLEFPYVVLGRRWVSLSGGAFGVPGGVYSLQIDCWSAAGGPAEAAAVLSRIAVLLERVDLTVTGYVLIGGSQTCRYTDVFEEPDADMPDRRLWHGLQRWEVEIHGA